MSQVFFSVLLCFGSCSESIICYRWKRGKWTHRVDMLIMAALEPLPWCSGWCVKWLLGSVCRARIIKHWQRKRKGNTRGVWMDAFAVYCTVAVMLMSSCSRNCRGSNLSVITEEIQSGKSLKTDSSCVSAMIPLSERKSRICTSAQVVIIYMFLCEFTAKSSRVFKIDGSEWMRRTRRRWREPEQTESSMKLCLTGAEI